MKLFDYLRRSTPKGAGGKATRDQSPYREPDYTHMGSNKDAFGKPYRQFNTINSTNKEQIAAPTEGKKSSKVNRTSYLAGGVFASDGTYREYPIIEFNKRFDYYYTIGTVQSAVDGFGLAVGKRKWYFKDTTDGGKGGAYSEQLQQMQKWAKYTVQVSQLFSEVIMNWTVGGTFIVSPKDWIPIQLRSIRAKIRDVYGNTETYIQIVNGQENHLPANEYLEIPYNNVDRLAWGTGLFDALMNDKWVDIDGRQPISTMDAYRQTQQDHEKIIHKQSNPMNIFVPADGEVVNQETIDNDIIPLISGAKPGDDLILNKRLEIIADPRDGKARYHEYSQSIEDEMTAGLQSSGKRLLTQPSAMADAKEAGAQDDDRIIGIMDKIKIFMDKHVIPAVLGIDAGWVEFEWGEVDTFQQQIPPYIDRLLELNAISTGEARQILESQHGFSFPELNEKNQQLEDDKKAEQLALVPDKADMKENDDAVKQKKDERDELIVRTNLLKKVEQQLMELK